MELPNESPISLTDAIAILVAGWIIAKLARRQLYGNSEVKTTLLKGPPRKSWLYGYQEEYVTSDDGASLYAEWLSDYGSVISVPWNLGIERIILTDPKAVAHFHARDTFGYRQPIQIRNFVSAIFGRGILWAEENHHRRQRKALNPAFTTGAIRNMVAIFFDSGYKTKAGWEALIDASDDEEAVIEVQQWMNSISLDGIGIAGFSHDFKALSGEKPAVQMAFAGLRTGKPLFVSPLMFLVSPLLPTLAKLSADWNPVMIKLRKSLSDIADDLLFKTRAEAGVTSSIDAATDRSVMGQLLKAESSDADMHMNKEEILAQMNTLLLAGYITTSITMTWALIELSRNKECQDRLREEFAPFSAADPTYDQLSSLPYLDAVVSEVLRLHPAIPETVRIAEEDDIVPLSEPIVTKTGETVSSIVIAKGSMLTVPIVCVNRSPVFWGVDAGEFRPERWQGDLGRALEIQGHRHLMTFSDGPRTCLGKGFALAEFKAAMFVLIRNFTFEFPDGPDTKIVKHRGLIMRPGVEGLEGPQVPLRVRKVDF